MIVSTTCNSDLLFLDKKYLTILKNKAKLTKSYINFNKGSACGYTELNNNNIKLASEASLLLTVQDDSSKVIFNKPLNINRSIYNYNSDEFNENRINNQSTTIMLNTIYLLKNFERLLNIYFTYNTNTNLYNLTLTYLERKTK